MISGNMVGMYSTIGKTLTIVDGNGTELVGVIVDQETLFTAGDNDVREGMVYASDSGVSTGTKDIPAYRTTAGTQLIAPGSACSIMLPQYNMYDYTVLQCMICLVDTSDISNSVSTNMVVLNNGTYEVNSTIKLSDVSKNTETTSIDLNITNNSENYYIIYFFAYRQEE